MWLTVLSILVFIKDLIAYCFIGSTRFNCFWLWNVFNERSVNDSSVSLRVALLNEKS